ncbi:hypothetical protein ACWD4G_20320 [Streptomyces sp. NPDC002643]
MRALLFGWRLSGHRAPTAELASSPNFRAAYMSPAMLRACLGAARRRRAPHLWPSSELSLVEADAITPVLVRAYVIPEDEQTRRLASPARRVW